jgi:hypothetical protein
VFENRVLREEVVGGWRRWHSEELHNLYASANIISMIKSRRMRWVVHVAHMGEMRNACKMVVGKPEGRRPCRRSRHRWEDNIRMDLREMDLIHLVHERDWWQVVANMVKNLWVS